MSRPGDRLHRLATRVCSDRTRRRLIDPAVADLQAEVSAARRAGSRWQALRALAAGYLSIAKVLVIAACGDVRAYACAWQPEERAGARQGAFVAVITIVVATGLGVVMLLWSMNTAGNWTHLAAYLAPSTLAFTMPLGLMLGVAWAIHGAARTHKMAVATMVLATVCSIGMFANLGWLTPEANQAFREVWFAREYGGAPDPPLARGFNELGWSAMRARLREARAVESPSEVRYLEAEYHRKLAIAIAPVPLVGMILALAFPRRWSRGRLMSAAVGVAAAHHLGLMMSSFFGPGLAAPPIVIGWSATAVCAAAAILVRAVSVRPAPPRSARA